jgi:hypothetical protein
VTVIEVLDGDCAAELDVRQAIFTFRCAAWTSDPPRPLETEQGRRTHGDHVDAHHSLISPDRPDVDQDSMLMVFDVAAPLHSADAAHVRPPLSARQPVAAYSVDADRRLQPWTSAAAGFVTSTGLFSTRHARR